MVDVQNASLAGGVGVGSAADLVISPGGAFGVGLVAGLISTFGFNYIQPFLLSKLGFHDTCGVHNLHAMPGFYAGVVSIIASAIWFPTEFYTYPRKHLQPAYQLATLFTTLGIAIGAGTIAGLMMRFLPGTREEFDDREYWLVEEESDDKGK